MGIKEQVIYCTPNGHLEPCLTILFFPEQPVSGWNMQKQLGEMAAITFQGRWAFWGSAATPRSVLPFVRKLLGNDI